MLPLLNSRRLDLLDHPRLINQICNLERRVARGCRDSIDHPTGGHDDLANVVAGIAAMYTGKPSYDLAKALGYDQDSDAEQEMRWRWRRAQLSAHIYGRAPP